MLGDMEEGVNGYVATPGGRFWYIDGDRGVATQICGPGALGGIHRGRGIGSDRRFYTLDGLRDGRVRVYAQ
jgi:hypothetical protein